MSSFVRGKKRLEVHHERICGILVGYFFVQVVQMKIFSHAKRGSTHRGFEVIGLRENVLMAEYVYYFLLTQLDFLVQERVKRSLAPVSRMERKSYRLGVLAGFQSKLRQSEDRGELSATASMVSRAIVKCREDPRLNRYLAEIHPDIMAASSAKVWIEGDAYSEGESAGRALVLKKAVTSGGEAPSHLLAHSGRLLDYS